MPSGDSPDGMGAKVRADRDGLFPRLLSAVPDGGSPTGTGESPALLFSKRDLRVLKSLRRAGPTLPWNERSTPVSGARRQMRFWKSNKFHHQIFGPP